MSTADHSLTTVLPAPVHAEASWWARLGRVMQSAWSRQSVRTTMPDAAPRSLQARALPITGKITAISVAGRPASAVSVVMAGPARSLRPEAPRKLVALARRPGVQGRWKASDRVAMP